MGKDRQKDDFLDKIDNIVRTGQVPNDVENSTPEDVELLAAAAELVRSRPQASEAFRIRLKHRLLLSAGSREDSSSSVWSWSLIKTKLSRTQLIAAAVVLSLVLLSSAALAYPMIRELIYKPTLGNIIVESTPVGAVVRLDDREVGTTPVALRDLRAGVHRLTLSCEDCEEFLGNITVEQNTTRRYKISLTRIEVIEIKPKDGTQKTILVPDSSPSNEAQETPLPADGGSQTSVNDKPSSGDTGNQSEQDSESTTQPDETDNTPSTQVPAAKPYILGIKNNDLVSIELGSKSEAKIVAAIIKKGNQTVFAVNGDQALIQTGMDQVRFLKLRSTGVEMEGFYQSVAGEAIINPSWSGADTILFGLMSNTRARLVELKIGSNQTNTVFEGSALGSISSNSRNLAVLTPEGLFIKNLNTDKSVKIFSGNQVQSPTWSPSGEKLAFIAPSRKYGNQSSSLFVVDSDGLNLLEIDREPNRFRWAPNSEKLAYETMRNTRSSIFLFDTRTAGSNRIIESGAGAVFDAEGNLLYLEDTQAKLLTLDKLEAINLIKDNGLSEVVYGRSLSEQRDR